MLYAVRIGICRQDWQRAIPAIRELIDALNAANTTKGLPPQSLNQLLTDIMRIVLKRQHQWLAERGIGAVVSPDESMELKFIYYFDSRQDADAFRHAFQRQCTRNEAQPGSECLLPTA